MENEAGEFVDLYCPRKCSASNRIIHAKDHASIQISIAEVDPTTGRMTDTSKSYALCGAIRRMGESDDCLVRLTKKDEILANNKTLVTVVDIEGHQSFNLAINEVDEDITLIDPPLTMPLNGTKTLIFY